MSWVLRCPARLCLLLRCWYQLHIRHLWPQSLSSWNKTAKKINIHQRRQLCFAFVTTRGRLYVQYRSLRCINLCALGLCSFLTGTNGGRVFTAAVGYYISSITHCWELLLAVWSLLWLFIRVGFKVNICTKEKNWGNIFTDIQTKLYTETAGSNWHTFLWIQNILPEVMPFWPWACDQ